MLIQNPIQVVPAANTDSATYFLSLQPITAGKSASVYTSPSLTYVPSTGVVGSSGLSVINNVLLTSTSASIASPLFITNTSVSTSNLTGALIVTGGAGITGNVNVGGAIYQNGIITPTLTTMLTYNLAF